MKSSGYALIFLLLALIAGGLYYFYSQNAEDDLNNKTWQENGLSNEQQEESQNNNFSLVEPEKINLVDPTGGENSGIAKRIYNNSQFIHTITANLSKIENNKFYQGWLTKEDQSSRVATGKLEKNDGEFYLEFKSDINYSDYLIVSVTLEEKDDGEPEQEVLKGEFNVK